ncbi:MULTISPECIES: helix-turn-helix domain-containing protein [unclassified Pantoea]|uniref:winged helix-turn-helix transcriptional regulator n=1 Tax=unclassified Pantoea TaxID=2630326 RepID=UPI0023DB9164|nr:MULTISPECIES: helix-turn-helix domain-containing protein [unclassified Pantoea]MDF2043816.1 helix-turn-helix domain-containing protein [Pantoea sp. Cr_R14]MDF2069815.1 helix-turn-helix domain-containing protein [Pantoea sp. Cr_R13]MDF2081418.1 helix-turn-helix domain-containing protein [Pantoea sp. Cr_R21]
MRRSGCPINLTLEHIGDRWSLIVIRDVMFENRRNYGTLLEKNKEGIATNILASRLKSLTASGLLTRSPDPNHQQKVIYSLTEAAIQLVPLLAYMVSWGIKHTDASKESVLRAEVLEKGGPALWDIFMDELRYLHLGATKPVRSVLHSLQAENEGSVDNQG